MEGNQTNYKCKHRYSTLLINKKIVSDTSEVANHLMSISPP